MLRVIAAIGVLAAVSGCTEPLSPAKSPTPSEGVEVSPGPLPGWLPPYAARQEALLASRPQSSVTHGATRVYPSFEHFDFSVPPPFARDQAEANAAQIRATLDTSGKLYVFEAIEPQVANPIALFGPPPPPEPDPWVRTVPNGGGYELKWARPSQTARRHVEVGNEALTSGNTAAALEAFRAAAEASPQVPELWVVLGRVLSLSGDDAAAEAAFTEALMEDARCFNAHLELALLYERRGALGDARRALAHALTIHSVSSSARQMLNRLGEPPPRPQLPPVFVEVGSSGAVVVGSAATPGARAYAACRAAMRHEPELRKELLGFRDPYQLSVKEEQLCAATLLVSTDPDDPEEKLLGEQLGNLVAQGHLTAFVLFDGLGRHRPEWLRLAPDPLFEQVVSYVQTEVVPPAP